MARHYGISKRNLIVLICCLAVVALVAVFFLTAAIVGQQNGLNCIEQIQSWFGILKETAPVEGVVEAVNVLKI